MSTEVMVALVGLLGSAFGSFAGILINTKLTTYRIEQLEKKQDKHNAVIERTYHLEQTVSVIEERVAGAIHRIDDLERGEKA